MPLSSVNQDMLKAARAAIAVMLKYKGQEFVLTPNKATPVAKPGGGHDFIAPPPRSPQVFCLWRTQPIDTLSYSDNDDGLARKRSYVLEGMWDADIAVGDTFSDEEADYTVDTLNDNNGYKVVATVTGFLKDLANE